MFYKLDIHQQKRAYVELNKATDGVEVQSSFERGSESVVPFLAGTILRWKIGRWGHENETESASM